MAAVLLLEYYVLGNVFSFCLDEALQLSSFHFGRACQEQGVLQKLSLQNSNSLFSFANKHCLTLGKSEPEAK